MKPLTIIFIFLILYALIPIKVSSKCYKNNLYTNEIEPVECKWGSLDKDLDKIQLNQVFDDGSQEMFKFVLNCASNNVEACNRIKVSLVKVAKYITTAFNFKEPVLVNATHYDFCSGIPLENCPLRNNIAKSGADAFYALAGNGDDDDGLERLYPQSLVKQFQFPSSPQFTEFDVIMELNAAADDVAWVEGDPPIKENQSDAFYIVLHELLHGLGFVSSWRPIPDDSGKIVGLMPILMQRDAKMVKNNQQLFMDSPSVKELIFDKYMIFLSDGSHTSSLTKQLDQHFLNDPLSPLGPKEIQLTSKMLELSTTPKSLGFLPRDGKDTKDAVILETSISEYSVGSSISHVDLQTYYKSPDFLMVFGAIPGLTVDQILEVVDGNPGEYIGPKTRSIFESLGYEMGDGSNPSKPKPFQGPSKASLKISQDFTLNICLLFFVTLFLAF